VCIKVGFFVENRSDEQGSIVQKREILTPKNLCLTTKRKNDIIDLGLWANYAQIRSNIKIFKKEEENANFQSACQTGPLR
jgi:hypothetical protein